MGKNQRQGRDSVPYIYIYFLPTKLIWKSWTWGQWSTGATWCWVSLPRSWGRLRMIPVELTKISWNYWLVTSHEIMPRHKSRKKVWLCGSVIWQILVLRYLEIWDSYHLSQCPHHSVLVLKQDRWALRNVSFRVNPGEVVALVGVALLQMWPLRFPGYFEISVVVHLEYKTMQKYHDLIPTLYGPMSNSRHITDEHAQDAMKIIFVYSIGSLNVFCPGKWSWKVYNSEAMCSFSWSTGSGLITGSDHCIFKKI